MTRRFSITVWWLSFLVFVFIFVLVSSGKCLGEHNYTMTGSRSRGNTDHGWAWVVLGTSVMLAIISEGSRSCIGIFYSQFVDTMNLTAPQAASIGAALNAAFYLPGPLATVVIRKMGARNTTLFGSLLTSAGLVSSAFAYSYWALTVTFGVMTGLGLCLTFLPVMGSLHLWFTRHRQLAPALCTTFGAVGIFLFPVSAQLLINTYSWRGAVIILGGISLNCAVTGATLFPCSSKSVAQKQSDTLQQSPNRSQTRLLFTDPAYLLHLFNAFFMFAFQLLTVFIVRHVVQNRDMTANQGAALVSVCGVCNCAGRALVALINCHEKTSTTDIQFLMFNLSTLFAAVIYASVPLFWEFRALIVVCGLAGFMQGVKHCCMINVTMDVTTPERFQTGYGYIRLVSGVSMLSGPLLAGYLTAVFGSYDIVFYLCGLTFSVSFVVGMACYLYERRRRGMVD